jgi:hypothetical protein
MYTNLALISNLEILAEYTVSEIEISGGKRLMP